MKRLVCPACGLATVEFALLPHPPAEPLASRALSKRYCPTCGIAVAIRSRLRGWHVLVFLAPLVLIYFKAQIASLGVPEWIYKATWLVALGALMWSVQQTKRLVRERDVE